MFWQRKAEPIEVPTRIKKLDTPSLLMWMDTTMMSLHQTFDAWRYHSHPKEEVTTALEALNDLWAEICQRGVDGTK